MIDQQRVLSSYNDGVQAVGYWARRVDPGRPHVCGHWTARDTAGHVLAVSRWYHEWLDRAEAGSSSPPCVAAELAERNAAALAAGPNDLEYLALIERFQEHADRYADRVAAAWDVAYGFPFGTVTAGLHQPLPELCNPCGPRQPTRHADDRDRLRMPLRLLEAMVAARHHYFPRLDRL